MGSSSTKIKERPLYTSDQQDLIDRLTSLAFRETRFPKFNPIPTATELQELGFERAAGFGGTALDQARQAAIFQGLARDPAFTIDPESRERFYNEAFLQPTMRDLRRDILPALAERFSGDPTSGFGAAALARATSDTMTNLGAQRAGLIRQDDIDTRNAAEAAATRQMQSIPMAQSESLRRIDVPLNVGAVERGIQAQRLGQRYATQFQRLNPQFSPALGLLGPALSPQTQYIPSTSSWNIL